VFWNVFQPPPAVAAAFAAVQAQILPESPINMWTRPVLDTYATMFGRAADGVRQAGGFVEPEQWRFDWEHEYARDDWLDQLPTFGGTSQLPAGQLAQLVAATGAALDALGGRFTMGYATIAVTATLLSGQSTVD
jgi:hypothetical protein